MCYKIIWHFTDCKCESKDKSLCDPPCKYFLNRVYDEVQTIAGKCPKCKAKDADKKAYLDLLRRERAPQAAPGDSFRSRYITADQRAARYGTAGINSFEPYRGGGGHWETGRIDGGRARRPPDSIIANVDGSTDYGSHSYNVPRYYDSGSTSSRSTGSISSTPHRRAEQPRVRIVEPHRRNAGDYGRGSYGNNAKPVNKRWGSVIWDDIVRESVFMNGGGGADRLYADYEVDDDGAWVGRFRGGRWNPSRF